MLKQSVHASKYFFARTLKSQPVKKTDGAEFRHPDIPCFEVMRLSLEAGVFFASYYVQIPILPLSFSQHKNVAKTPLFLSFLGKLVLTMTIVCLSSCRRGEKLFSFLREL